MVIILEIFLIISMCSTCFSHQSRSAYSIRSVTYDKCFRLTSARWSSQMTAEHGWSRLLYRWSFISVRVTQHCFSNVTMMFVTWLSRAVAVSGNCWKRKLPIRGVAVVFVFYLTESVIIEGVLYYSVGAWRWQRNRENCKLRILSVSVISHCSAIYQQIQ